VAVAVREEASDDLSRDVDEIHWVSLGQLGRCIATLKAAGVRKAVMAGQVKHRQLFSDIVPDMKFMGVMARLAFKNTDSLLGGVANALEKEGIVLVSSIELLQDQLARQGAMTSRRPSAGELADIRYGRNIALTLAGLDLGQAVAIKDQAAVALEAMEGTDEMIRRAGRIAGAGVTIVKVAKPKQDLRFDVPVVGIGTLNAMSDAEARTLAVDAGSTLILEREEFLKRADAMELAVWGMSVAE
jgi:DUF1009 family protein